MESVVSAVSGRSGTGTASETCGRRDRNWGVFQKMEDAVEASHEAFLRYSECGVQDRKRFSEQVRKLTLEHKETFSRMAVEQTGMGRVEHKILKHINVAKNSSGFEFLRPEAWSGKNGLALDEWAPFGVIGNITPSTHPGATMLDNIIIQLAGGNTIVFNPHPSAKRLSALVIQTCNQYMVKAGAPENLVTCVADPTPESAEILFTHPKVKLLSITGGPGIVAMAMKAAKPIIAAGPGNPPVLIDETADIELAAKEITDSASFDNNILCIAEKEIFVVEKVFDPFMKSFEEQGNVRLTAQQMNTLAEKALVKEGKHYIISRDFVGRNASVLAMALGMQISDEVPLLFGEIGPDHPWVLAEQMTPCIPVVKVRDFKEGVQAALKAEHGFEHTAGIFTRDMNRATEYAKTLNTDVIVINGGTLRGNGGDRGEGTFSHTIASPTGQGIVTPRSFCRHRRIMTTGAMRFV